MDMPIIIPFNKSKIGSYFHIHDAVMRVDAAWGKYKNTCLSIKHTYKLA